MTEACDLSATRLSTLFARRALSPVELLGSVLARLDEAEPFLAACWAIDREGALAAARAAEGRWMAGEPLSSIDGISVTVKELIATKGVAKPMGTAAGDMTPQDADAPPAARVREAGAVLFAKTTTPDFGMLSSGLSSFHKLARNPWDVSKSPGGSSAGAGSAAAAGYGPLHIGTDIGGSTRLPAGWCGIFGFKPSFGRVPIDPPYTGRVAGPMTRTVADSALLMSILSRPDPRDYMSLPPADLPWERLERDLKGLRIGLMLDAGCGLAVDPEIRDATIAAAQLFADAGAIVEPVVPFFTRAMLDGIDIFWRARFFDQMTALPEDRQALILPYIRQWVEPARGYSGAQVYRGSEALMQIREKGRDAFAPFDFMLSPTAPVAAFPAEYASPLNDPARPFEHIGFTVPWNMTEQPAASINCGYTAAGLPIGLQIVGRRFDDAGVLQVSHAYEQMRPAQRPWPEPWKDSAE